MFPAKQYLLMQVSYPEHRELYNELLLFSFTFRHHVKSLQSVSVSVFFSPKSWLNSFLTLLP
jgi:hypothetical protein